MSQSKFYLVMFCFVLGLLIPDRIECKSISSLVPNNTIVLNGLDSLCDGTLGPNLLSTGTFGMDTTQIVPTDPNYTLGYDYENNPPPDDGHYTVTNDISNWGSFADLFWINIGDNSADTTGYMMVVNAHFDPGNFVKEVVSVCENTTYVFSCDLINLTKKEIPNFILPNVDFLVNGAVVSSSGDIPQDETWRTSQFSYTTGPGETLITYVIRNNAPGGFGNDLALDNIFMNTCLPEIEISKHGIDCLDEYLEATVLNAPGNFTPHYLWQYSLDEGFSWISLPLETSAILSLSNQIEPASYRCLTSSGSMNFDNNTCYATSNQTKINFGTLSSSHGPITICENEVFSFNGNLYDTTGIYVDTLINFFGCDSIVTNDLIVLSISASSREGTICDNEVYDFEGTLLTATGIYQETMTNTVGCDSVITLDLVKLVSSTKQLQEEICEDEAFFFKGIEQSSSGVYIDTLAAANGCDSIVVLDLLVHSKEEIFIEKNICESESYLFDGQMLNTTGEYSQHLLNQNNCDSIITYLNLIVDDKNEQEITTTLCSGESFEVNGNSYMTSGTYYETLSSHVGCDSFVVLNLTIVDALESVDSKELCPGDTYFFKGAHLDETGMYLDTLQSSMGCDSILTLQLQVRDESQYYYSDEICQDENYVFNDLMITTSGVYSDTLINQYGCDSLVFLELDILPKYELDLPVSICANEAFTYEGVTYDATGNYPIALNSANNCDSIVMLQLNIEAPILTTLNKTICEGESLEMGGNIYNETGYYETVMPAYLGCDSTIQMNLSVYENEVTYLTETICYGEVYQVGSASYSAPGMHSTQLISSTGCDSTVELSLSVYQSVSTQSMTLCNGETFNGVDSDTLLSVVETSYLGCDSIINLQLYFSPAYNVNISGDPIICNGGETILEVANFSEYLWSDGTTTKENTISSAGLYSVTVTDANGCSGTQSIQVQSYQIEAEVFVQDPSCDRQDDGIIQVFGLNGGGGDYSYSINGRDYVDDPTFFDLVGGTYEIKILDSYGCEHSTEVQLATPSQNELMLGVNEQIEYGDSMILSAEVVGRIDSFFWYPTEGLSCVDCLEPMASPLTSTIYSLTVVTEQGCVMEEQIHVFVYKPKDVFVPNIFSPNNDGVNDDFFIYAGVHVEAILQFDVYNRWGEHIYTETPNSRDMDGWNGMFLNEQMDPGVYIYMAKVKYTDGDEVVYKGDITLVR